MSRRSPIDVVTGLRNTRRSMGDGTIQGRVRNATPYRRGSARRIPASKIVAPVDVRAQGWHLRVSVPAQTWAADGLLTFSSEPVRNVGWGDSDPLGGDQTRWVAPRPGYCTLTLDGVGLDLGSSTLDPVQITVEVDGEVRWSEAHRLNENGFEDWAVEVGDVHRSSVITVRTDTELPVAGGEAVMQLVDQAPGQANPPPLSEPAGYVGAVSDEDSTQDTASVSLSPHASTAEGDIVLIAVNTSKTGTGDYGTFTPDGTPTELHRFPFSAPFGATDGAEAAVYWWRSDGTLPTFTYELTGTGVQNVVVTMITYAAENFPSSGDPFVGVAQDWGTSGTDTRSTRAANDPGGDWTVGVAFGVRNTTTVTGSDDYEILWASMIHNIQDGLRGGTAGDFISTPQAGGRRSGFHTQGALDGGGVSATFGEEYTHQWVLAAGVGRP